MKKIQIDLVKKLEQIKQEKEELEKIKEILEDTNPKIDISNVYVLEKKGIYYLVYKQVQPIVGRSLSGIGPLSKGYSSKLIDIFDNQIVYEKSSIRELEKKELLQEIPGDRSTYYYIYIIPIIELEPNLLVYIDKKVPLYVLIQLYYKLNKVNVNAKVLKKEK